MKGPITSANAIVQGLKGWVTRRPASFVEEIETPETEVASALRKREFDEPRDRWPLGPSVDNYS